MGCITCRGRDLTTQSNLSENSGFFAENHPGQVHALLGSQGLIITIKLDHSLGTINHVPNANRTRPPTRAQFSGIGSPSVKP